MIEDLDHLASRLRQLAQLAQDLRAENRSLQGELGRRDAQIRSLLGTLATAQSRVDAVLERLPLPPSEVAEEAESDIDPTLPADTLDRSLHGTP